MVAVTERPPTRVEVEREKPGGDRFVAVALWTVALILLALQALAREVFPPLAAFAVVYVAAGAAVAHRGSRGRLVMAIVLGAVHLAGSIPFAVVHLAHPESPGSFLLEVFTWLAVLVVLAGAVTGLRGGAGSRGRIAAAAAGLAGVAVIVSVIAASGAGSDSPHPGDVAIEAQRTRFPAQVEVPVGGAVLWIDNRDPFHHTLVVEDADIHVAMPAYSAVRTEVDLDHGTYRYHCDVPGHDGMEGELVVR